MRPEELDASGGACVAAALAVPVTAPAEAVRGVEVVPGGRAGPAAAALADRWEIAVALWSADLVAFGERLAAAAGAYARGDADGAGALAGGGR
ncbi:hypothetical protein C8D89_10429 [Actinomycetospora cinnamomea]|uniref:Excreted virulence factor EspC (Type VII ESX diderm) n=1 Tax=Actinomycetospora cinnamomea TaxID=663609 RepID=A0A2U1FF63_9PSEU|nr:hypothetical protein C8D89_10429 [Actinomycetospora cinnamomea]